MVSGKKKKEINGKDLVAEQRGGGSEGRVAFVLSGQRNLPVRGGADWAADGDHGADLGGRACPGKGQVEKY